MVKRTTPSPISTDENVIGSKESLSWKRMASLSVSPTFLTAPPNLLISPTTSLTIGLEKGSAEIHFGILTLSDVIGNSFNIFSNTRSTSASFISCTFIATTSHSYFSFKLCARRFASALCGFLVLRTITNGLLHFLTSLKISSSALR